MKLTVPEYYENFKCIAGDCKDSCCIGWEIDIDEDTLRFYQSLPGDFGDRLRAGIKDGSFILNEERCPFLNHDNLCDIILNIGEDKLCTICSRHPRFAEQYCKETEAGLGLSCLTCAELILSAPLPPRFIEKDVSEADAFGYVENDDDPEALRLLKAARDRMFDIISTAADIKSALRSIICLADLLQDAFDFGDTASAESIISMSDLDISVEEASDPNDTFKMYVSFLHSLDSVDSRWEKHSRMLENASFCGDKYVDECRRLIVYYIYRYLLKAMLDGDILTKVCACVFSVVITNALLCAANSKEDLSFDEICSLSASYSKQMEYSDENFEMLCEKFYSGEFSVSDLISILM